MTEANNTPSIPEVDHPNAVELNVDQVRQQALESLGLSDKVAKQGMEALSTEQAAQVGQAMADRLEALQSNVNMQSE
jgi:hypothetical protein